MHVKQPVEGLLSDMIPAVFQFYCYYKAGFQWIPIAISVWKQI